MLPSCSKRDDTRAMPSEVQVTDEVQVTISATSARTSPSDPTTLTVRLENRGSSPVTYLTSSGSCALAVIVQVGIEWLTWGQVKAFFR